LRLQTGRLCHASSTALLLLTCLKRGLQMQHPLLLVLLLTCQMQDLQKQHPLLLLLQAWQLIWTCCCYVQWCRQLPVQLGV
jgi:hypothetical protein